MFEQIICWYIFGKAFIVLFGLGSGTSLDLRWLRNFSEQNIDLANCSESFLPRDMIDVFISIIKVSWFSMCPYNIYVFSFMKTTLFEPTKSNIWSYHGCLLGRICCSLFLRRSYILSMVFLIMYSGKKNCVVNS